MAIVVIGVSHHTAPVAVRERLAFDEARIPATLDQLRASGVAGEAVIVSTCNRVEIYAATALPPDEAGRALKQFLCECQGYEAARPEEFYTLVEPESVRHLFRVACGLDSMVIGETEVLGQLKKAYALALAHGHTGSSLNKAFQRAFQVAKQVRTQTNIQRGSISVASVAVELAEKIFQALADCTVLVMGAGDTSEKAARALVSRGVGRLLVANRSPDHAAALAHALGGQAVPFERWLEELEKVDIVISSTAAPGYLLGRAQLASVLSRRNRHPLLLIDIAVPRDIDPEVNLLENVYLYNIDDLQTIADDYLRQRKEEVARCEALIQEKVNTLLGASGSGAQFGGWRPTPKLSEA